MLESIRRPFSRGTSDVSTLIDLATKSMGVFGTQPKQLPGSLIRLLLNQGGEDVMKRPTSQNAIVYACAMARMRGGQATKARIWTDRAHTKEVNYETDPIAKLLRRPAPLVYRSWKRFIRGLICQHDMEGGSYLLMVSTTGGKSGPVEGGGFGATIKVKNIPDELWPVRDDFVEPVLDDKTKLPAQYKVQTDTGYDLWPAHAVRRIYEPDPFDPMRPIAPMHAAYRAATKDFTADRYDEALLANGGEPGGIFTAPKSTAVPNETQMKMLRESYDRQVGAVINRRKALIVPPPFTFDSVAFSPKDLEFKDLRELTRDTIMAVFGVTRPVLGLTEGLNYASASEARLVFWEETMLPLLDLLFEDLESELFTGLPTPFDQYGLTYDTSGVSALRLKTTMLMDQAIKLQKESSLSLRDGATLVGWVIPDPDAIKGIDDRYVPRGTEAVFDQTDAADGTGAAGDGTGTSGGVSPLAGGAVQDKASNGAQVAGLLEILHDVGAGALTPDSAVVVITALFPTIAPEAAAKMVAGAKKVEPDPVPVAPAAAATTGKSLSLIKPITRSLKNQAHAETFARAIAKPEKQMASRIRAVMQSMVLAARKRVGELASAGAVSLRSPAHPHDYDAKVNVDELVRALGLDQSKWSEQMLERTKGAYQEAFSVGAKLGQQVGSVLLLQSRDSIAIEILKAKPIKLAEGSATKVARMIADSIVEHLADTDPHMTLEQRIYAVLDDVREDLRSMADRLGTRAAMIARTEIGSTTNIARLLQMKSDGVEKIEWVSAHDELVRLLHQIDGQVVRIGEPFSNGLQIPGDPNGDAANLINCRCTFVAHFDD